ncbi:MAG TPA: DNA-binding response regulator, partial [Proteobacteria bacterium]|nr:DNA-binding response regulator [Pseudomonadota bacterium]
MANKLLFIDPDKTVVEELGPIFERRGFEVGWAADGESGLS